MLAVSLILVLSPDAGSGTIDAIFAFVTQRTGAWFLLAGGGSLVFLLLLTSNESFCVFRHRCFRYMHMYIYMHMYMYIYM